MSDGSSDVCSSDLVAPHCGCWLLPCASCCGVTWMLGVVVLVLWRQCKDGKCAHLVADVLRVFCVCFACVGFCASLQLLVASFFVIAAAVRHVAKAAFLLNRGGGL